MAEIKSVLYGKTALITGSTSGIGCAIAHVLASHGFNICLNGFASEDTIASITASIGEKQRNFLIDDQDSIGVMYDPADVSNAEEVKCMIEAVKHRFGGLDVLVNNAGIQHIDRVEDFPIEKWNQLIAVNLSSAFYCTHYAVPIMKDNGWGRIIHIASVHGLVASTNKIGYCASKHGLVGLSKVVALELAESGITSNTICPGFVRTPLIMKQVEKKAEEFNISLEEATVKLCSEKSPSKKMIEPEAIGEIIVFLCSSAADQITGAQLSMDGGWTTQ